MKFRSLLLKLSASLLIPLLASSDALAQQPAGPMQSSQNQRDARAEAFVEAIGSGDFDRFFDWYRTNAESAVSVAEAREQFDRYIEEWGGLSPMGVFAPAENILVIDARAGKGGRISLRFEFSPEAPFLVRSVSPEFTPPAPPVEAPANWTSLQSLIDAVREGAGVPALTVGVHHQGESESAISGVRRSDSGEIAQINDAFNWASVGKSVTGSTLASLVDDGVLRWDSTVGEIIGSNAVHEVYRSVPLWMLASHQAGVPPHTDFDMSFEQQIAALPGNDIAAKRTAYVEALLKQAPDFTPGTDAQYSNGGYMVLGYLAERATGVNWEDLVEEHVLNRLNMNHSAPSGVAHQNRVAGHMAGPGGTFQPEPGLGASPISRLIAPAGGISGSIVDLTRFAAAHLRGLNGQDSGLGSADLVQQLHSMQPGQQQFNGEDYTFGWGDRCIAELPENVRCRSHNGGNGLFFAQILIIPEYDLAITLLANNTDAGVRALDPVFNAVFERYTGHSAPSE